MDPVILSLTERVIAKNEKRIIDWIGAAGKAALDIIRFNCAGYIESSFEKCSRVTTLLDRDEATLVSSIYVKTFLEHRKVGLDDAKLLSLIEAGGAFVIQGMGGSGKSMLMKHLFLQLIASSSTTIPIFIELRGLNELASKDLIAFIYYSITGPSGATMTLKQFRKGIEDRFFTLFLDGFDEIDMDQHIIIQRQVLDIRKDFPSSAIVISSRPDERFSSWASFKNYHVQPMKKNEVLALIELLDYDKTLKKKFFERVKKDLYEKNASFLSNPLLVTIMMITFHQFAEIPHKIHLFYEYAFEALFFRHDASKEAAFNRKKKTKLAMNEFRNLLSAFSMFSYAKEKFSFSASEVLDFIQESKHFENINVVNQDFFEDLVRAVCMLQPEGTSFIFTHRSFQEYFSAVFLVRGKTGKIQDILEWIMNNRSNDNVVQMAFSIAPSLIEREWILPKLNQLLQVSYKSSLDFLLKVGGAPRIIGIDKSQVIVGVTHNHHQISFVFLLPSLYPNFFEQREALFSEESRSREAELLVGREDEQLCAGDDDLFDQLSAGKWINDVWNGCIRTKEYLEIRHAASEKTIESIFAPTKTLSTKRKKTKKNS